MPAPSSRYRQVLLTYWRRPAFRWVVGAPVVVWAVWAAIYAAALGATRVRLPWDIGTETNVFTLPGVLADAFYVFTFLVLLSPPFALVGFVTLVLTHLRTQLDDPVSAMMPHSRRAHVAVAASVFLVVPAAGLVFYAVLMNSLVNAGHSHDALFSGILGPVAVTLSVMTLAAFWSMSRAPWFSLLLIPLVLLALTWPPLGKLAGDLLNSDSPDYVFRSVAIITINLLLLRLIFARIARPTHDRPEGRRAAPGPSTPPSIGTATKPHARRRPPATGTLARALRRRRGILAPVAPWVVAGLLAALLVFVTFVNGPSPSDLFRSVLLPSIIPGIVISFIWRERWSNMGYESLYPAGRNRFVGELLAATAITLAELWVATTVSVLVPVLVWRTAIVRQESLFAVTLVASAAIQVFVFGVMFVAARSRPLLPFVNVVTVLAAVVPITLAWGENPMLAPAGLLAAATVEMLLGLSLTAFGFTAWRGADLA